MNYSVKIHNTRTKATNTVSLQEFIGKILNHNDYYNYDIESNISELERKNEQLTALLSWLIERLVDSKAINLNEVFNYCNQLNPTIYGFNTTVKLEFDDR